MKIYTDGSYRDGKAAWGFIVKDDNGKLLHCQTGAVKANKSANIEGELIAVMKAVEWALSKKHKVVHIYYDYSGIEKFATGEWIPKQPITQFYWQFINLVPIQVVFHKVKGHLNHGNNIVDTLTRDALKKPPQDRQKLFGGLVRFIQNGELVLNGLFA